MHAAVGVHRLGVVAYDTPYPHCAHGYTKQESESAAGKQEE